MCWPLVVVVGTTVNPYAVVAYLTNTKWCKKMKNDRNPGKWVLIWENSASAFQWVPTRQGLGDSVLVLWMKVASALEGLYCRYRVSIFTLACMWLSSGQCFFSFAFVDSRLWLLYWMTFFVVSFILGFCRIFLSSRWLIIDLLTRIPNHEKCCLQLLRKT